MCDLFSLAEDAVFQVHQKGLEMKWSRLFASFLSFPRMF